MARQDWASDESQDRVTGNRKYQIIWDRRAILLLACLTIGGLSVVGTPAWVAAVSSEYAAAVHQAKVLPSDGAAADFFGESVAVSGDTMVVGAPATSSAVKSGSAYIFVRTGGVWVQQAKLVPVPFGPGPSDAFGSSVAIEGNTVVVGAPGDVGRTGAAYVFTRTGGTWTQRFKLTASDGFPADNFGWSVAINGALVLVGAPDSGPHGPYSGSAYMFLVDLDPLHPGWAEVHKFTASPGADHDFFGLSVAINSNGVVIGAPYDDDSGTDSGAVYVFVPFGVGGWFQSKLTASDGASGDHFGESVRVSGNTMVVGASRDGHVGMVSGCAYVFDHSTGSWIQSAKLAATDGTPGDYFGHSVAVSGNSILIGAMHDSGRAANTGSAHLFTRSGGIWTRQAKLTAADGATGDDFGSNVAIAGNTLAVGASGDDSLAAASGSAYVSLLNEAPLADAGPDQEVRPGNVVTLNASNSRDRDNTIASYRWKRLSGPRVRLSNPRASQVTFIAPEVDSEGATLVFEVKVRDRDRAQASDTCLVTVTTDNRPPIAKAGAAQRVLSGTGVTLNGSRSRDPDGTPLRYRWKQVGGPHVVLSGRSAPQASFTAPMVGWCGASLQFLLTVTDRSGLKAEDTTVVNIFAGNLPPKARAGRGQTVAGGTRVRLDGSASRDADDGIASYRWVQLSGPPVRLSNPMAIKPSFWSPRVNSEGATLRFQLTVTDLGGLQSQSRCQIRVAGGS